VSPCSALWRGSSLGRSTVSVAPLCAIFSSGLKLRESSPLGPFTRTVEPSTVTCTLPGTSTGRLPIRDMVASYQTTARSSPPVRC
jgi:hypothetical protein